MMSYNLTEKKFNYLKNNFKLVPLFKSITSEIDPTTIFKHISIKNSVLLHSPIKGKNSRYSIIATDPDSIIHSKNGFIYINGKKLKGDPFAVLKKSIKNNKINDFNLPFNGGLIGFFSYDFVHYIEKLPKTTKDDLKLPDFCFGVYNNFIIHDNLSDIIKIVSLGDDYQHCKSIINELESKLNLKKPAIGKNIKIKNRKIKVSSNFTKRGYFNAITKVKEYIFAGDTYQVNLSQRFSAKIYSDAISLYERLVKINPSPFSAFLDFENFNIISSSPERLVKLNNGIVETRPIAGTRKRGINKIKDKKMEKELKTNPKELAEHTMLVDLSRNDIGRVCRYGSIKVDEKFVVERYSHVMHLVSNVIGKLREDKDAFDLIKAIFPGGTITGCPKVRTMEIIDELEPTSRGPYTGSIGYIDYSGNLDLNIIIRTIVLKDHIAYFQAGGGIVADSKLKFEFEETISKAKALFNALEGMK